MGQCLKRKKKPPKYICCFFRRHNNVVYILTLLSVDDLFIPGSSCKGPTVHSGQPSIQDQKEAGQLNRKGICHHYGRHLTFWHKQIPTMSIAQRQSKCLHFWLFSSLKKKKENGRVFSLNRSSIDIIAYLRLHLVQAVK